MSKVKESKARKTGSTSVSGTEQKALEGRKMITAERNGEIRNFKPGTWGNLPPEKEGWKEVSSKPAEITNTSKPDEGSESQTKKADTETGDEKKPNVKTVDHVITQEDLDLDPELAKTGVKVGEVIQIEETKGGTE